MSQEEYELQQKEMTKLFLKRIRKTKKKFMDALLRCNALQDQTHAETLRTAIAAISNTIAALKEGTATLGDLKRYHIGIKLVEDPEEYPAVVTVSLKQRERSHPIPLSHYIEIRPPLIEKSKTPLFRERVQSFSFEVEMDFGPRTEAVVREIASADLEFNIMKGGQKPKMIALATTSLSPLTYTTSVTAPLHFVAIDGSKTNFAFDCCLTVERPLVPASDLVIDEIIDVIPDD